MNVLLIIFTFLILLLLGYGSFLRTTNHYLRPASQFLAHPKKLKFKHIAQAIGLSGLLFILPSIVILLYWGWGLALIWVLFYHVVLESTTLQSLYAPIPVAKHASVQKSEANNQNLTAHNIQQKHAILALQYGFLIGVSSACLHFLMILLDSNANLTVFLVLLIALYRLEPQLAAFKSKKKAAILGVLTLLALFLSSFFKLKLFGNITLFSISALQIDASSLLAIIIVYCLFDSKHDPRFFASIFSRFIGGVVLIATPILLLALIIANPAIDAPISANDESNHLPTFFSFQLFIAFGFISLCIIHPANGFLSGSKSTKYENIIHNIRYREWQVGRLCLLLLSAFLILLLASTSSIGEWKSHFFTWSSDLDLSNTFKLGMHYILSFSTLEKHTFFVVLFIISLFALSGFSILNSVNQQFIALYKEQSQVHDTQYWKVALTPFFRSSLIVIIAIFFLNTGISIAFWATCGVLAWLLICNQMIAKASYLIVHHAGLNDITNANTALVFMVYAIGILSVTILLFSSAIHAWWGLFIIAIITLFLSHWLWFARLKQLYFFFIKPKPVKL